MRSRILAAALAAAALALTGLAIAGPASAGAISCTPDGTVHLSVTAGSQVFYLSTPNKVFKGSVPELKTFGSSAPNATTVWTRCVASGQNAVALTVTYGGTTYAAQNNKTDLNHVYLEPVAPSGPSLAQFWAVGSTGTLKNLNSGLYERVPNSGPAQYATVVAGASPTSWIFS